MFCASVFSRVTLSRSARSAFLANGCANRVRSLTLILLTGVFAVSQPALADDDLATALAAYWLRHPDAQALDARVRAADAGVTEAHSLFAGAPTLSLSRLNEQQQDGGSETELELALPLASGRAQRQQQAGAEQQALHAEIAALRLQLSAELLRLDGERQFRNEQLALSRQRLQLSQKLTANVANRVQAGELANTDLLLANAETLAAESALLSAEQTADEATNAWQLRVGQRAALAVADVAPTAGEISTHPQLQQAIAQAQAATARTRYAERRSNDAELSLLLKREEDPLLDQTIDSAGLKLSVPLFAGSRRDADVARAEVERSRADAEALRLQQQLTQEQLQARGHWQRVHQQQRLIQQQLTLTEQSWRFAEAAFAAGELSLSDLLRQQQRLFDTRERVAEQQLQQRDALARLILAEGQLP